MADEPNAQGADPFALSETYPGPAAIFSFQPSSIDRVAASAIFVIDTSALLVPSNATPTAARNAL